jgi:adenosylhomocysteine nucleosidase
MACPLDMDVLFVAAEPREFSGFLRHCERIEKPGWPVSWARRGKYQGGTVGMVANGAGPKRAAAAAEAACAAEPPRAIVSVGFCGALDPALAAGDVFVAHGVRFISGAPGEASTWGALRPRSDRSCAAGTLMSLPYVIQTAEQKRILYGSGASAVEMESAGVMAVAAKRTLPFYCVRAVTDGADESFANDFNAVLGRDGRVHVSRVLAHALRRPASRIPELLRLQRRCRLAADNLGDFIADCRF